MRFDFAAGYLLVSTITLLLLCVYAWRNRQLRSTKTFSIACFTSVLWMSGDVIERLSATFDGEWAGEIVRFIGVCFLPVALLIFIREFCGKPLGRKHISLLCIVPTVSWLIMLTNSWHSLFFTALEFNRLAPPKVQYGIYFWLIHLPYCYVVWLVGFITVLLERRRASAHYRPQISILLFALCIPPAVNIVGVFKIIGEVGYTALSFPIFFSVVGYAVFRYQFLKSNPIAYEKVFQTIRDGVIIFNQNNIITDINPAAAKSLGKSPGEVISQSFDEAFAPWLETVAKYRDEIDLYDEVQFGIEDKSHFLSVSITPLKSKKGALDGRIFTLRDITDRKQYEFSLEELAFHDPLTRLANRQKFQEEVEMALQKARESSESLALLYFDLNHFKLVNDTYGHETGDELLKYVAARISSILRKPDLLARLGGDEFAALLHNCGEDGVDLVVERILDNAQRPFKIGEQMITPDLSVGAAIYPDDGATIGELLRRADAAMYQNKQEEKISFTGGEIEVSSDLRM